MNVIRKLHLLPVVIQGMVLKPMFRKINKWWFSFIRANSVRSRNKLNRFDKSKYTDVKHILKQDGFVKLRDDVLPMNEVYSFIDKINQLIDSKEVSGQESKQFWQRPLSGTQLNSNHFLVKFAMHESILNIVSDYIGGLPLLNSVELIRSVDNGTDKYSKSQLWHNDHDDVKMVKFFVYLSNVINNDEGPFEYFDSPTTKSMSLRYFPVHKIDTVINAATESKHKSVFGQAGTCFLVDTNKCLHRGSRINGEAQRLSYIALYTSSCRLVSTEQRIQISHNADDFTAALIKPIDI